MIAIVHSIYSQSVHAPALHAGLMDNDAERDCMTKQSMRAGLATQLQSYRLVRLQLWITSI